MAQAWPKKEFHPSSTEARDYCHHYVLPTSRAVVLHGAKFRCTCCGNWKGASAFGLFNDTKGGVIRNQPQCKVCRSRYGGG